jgi:Tn3 transposase DDE domain-containing protein
VAGPSSWWVRLRQDPGPVGIKSARAEIEKLQALRSFDLPADLFAGVSRRVLDGYRQRAMAERPAELRAHADATRYALIAAFCKLRTEEVTDNLVELLIHIIHNIGAKAEKKVVKELLEDFQQVTGKTGMLYRLAEAAVDNPDGVVRDVLFPVVGEQALKYLVREYKSSGPAYRIHVHTRMRASYGRHYRQVLPKLLATLEFASNNEVHRPVIDGLELLKRYVGSPSRFYAPGEEMPLNGVVTGNWWDLVVKEDGRGRMRVERIAYEVCLLEALRDKVRCKEIWVAGAHRWRNPDEDLPQDFDKNRDGYYRLLCQPREAEAFVGELQRRMSEALQTFERGLPKNRDVKILDRGNGWISLSPLEPRPEPANIVRLKAAMVGLWPMISLLDMAKETDLRVPFTPLFRSVLSRENLDRRTLQKRILLCIYALGTNTGIKRMAAGDHGESYDDLRYARRRFMQPDWFRRPSRRSSTASSPHAEPTSGGRRRRPAPRTPRSSAPGTRTS